MCRKLSVYLFVLFFFSFFYSFLFGLNKKHNNNDLIDLLKTAKWKYRWADGSKTGAVLRKNKKGYIVKGISKINTFGSIYADIVIDFDKCKELLVEVPKVKGYWYMLIADQNFPGGYIHIQMDTMEKGSFKYDLKQITGFKGKRKIQFHIGISSRKKIANKDLFILMSKLQLKRLSLSKQSEKIRSTNAYDPPEAQMNLRGWQDHYPDGSSTGATIYFEGKKGVIVGAYKNLNYGFVYRDIEIDLNKNPILELSINEVSQGWYLVIQSDELPWGLIKLERNNPETGIFRYDLKNILKLSGKQRLQVALGVVVEKIGVKSNIDQFLKFNYIKFKKFLTQTHPDDIDINSISLRNRYFISKKLPLKTLKISTKVRDIEKEDIKQDLLFNTLNELKDIYNEFSYKTSHIKQQRSDFILLDKGDLIILQNKFIQLVFNSKNGSLIEIINILKNKRIILNNPHDIFWRMEFDKGRSKTSKDFKFKYTYEDNELIFFYTDVKTGSQVSIEIVPSNKNYIDFIVTIYNKYKRTLLSFSFPETISFNYRRVKQVVFPYKLGIGLLRSFYQKRKELLGKYPDLFADLVSLQLDQGSVSIYGIQKDHELFRPADLETGYYNFRGGIGYYTHKYICYTKKNEEIELPVIRMNFNNNFKEVIKDYNDENGISRSASLKEKAGFSLFNRLKKSILLKVELLKNRDFNYIRNFLNYLSSPAIIHLVSFWPKGFDRNYPDYLPPDKAYGTTEDMRSLCKRAKDMGFIVMPYTNPTWWNKSKTLSKLGLKNIALINKNKRYITENYNNSIGYLVNPFNNKVISRINKTVEEFTKIVPCDILFEDQLGAREWIYAYNKDMPSPLAYSQGMINTAKRNSKKISLFTEEGFDRLIPYELGFCNMSAANHLPPDDYFNIRFGDNNWQYFPLALYMAHDKIAFYQHNLAHEVFADTREKISWNMVFGHSLNIGRWVSDWNRQRYDYKIADTIQKEIISEYFGKKLTHFQILDEDVYCSQFKDIIVIGNFSKENYKVNRYTIVPGGFMVINKTGTLLAGIFNRFNGEYLGGERIIILKLKDNRLYIKQLDPENCFITLPRLKEWKFNNKIEAFYGDESIPCAINRKGITIYLKYGQDINWYSIRYNKRKQKGFDVRFDTSRKKESADLKLSLLSFQDMEKVKIGIQFFIVNPQGAPPDDSGVVSQEFFSEIEEEIEEDEKVVYNFNVPILKTIPKDHSIWLRINIYEDNRRIDQLDSIIKLSENIDIVFKKRQMYFYPNEKKELDFYLYNYSNKTMKGEIKIKSPKEFILSNSIPFILKKYSKKKIKTLIRSKKDIDKKRYTIKLNVISDKKNVTESIIKVIGEPTVYFIDINPVNLLKFDKPNKLSLVLRDLPKYLERSFVSIELPNQWKISGFKNKMEIDLSRDNILKIPFTVTPSKKRKGDIKVKIQQDKQKIIYRERFKCFSEDNVEYFKTDMNNDKIKDVIIGNKHLELVITPIIGGRVLKLINRKTGNNLFYTEYPEIQAVEGSHWQNWAEYGGMNDWWPKGWPGDVWNNQWRYKIYKERKKRIQADFYTKSRDNRLSLCRSISLNNNDSFVEFYYKFKNLTSQEVPFFYNSHPDFAPGKNNNADAVDYAVIPVKKRNKIKMDFYPFSKSQKKRTFLPADNWCVALDDNNNEYCVQIFEKHKVKGIGVWQGVNFFSMELLSEKFFLDPYKTKDFRYYYFIGQNDWQDRLSGMKKMITQERVELNPLNLIVEKKSKKRINKIAFIDFRNMLEIKDLEYLSRTIPESISIYLDNHSDYLILDSLKSKELIESYSLNLKKYDSLKDKIELGKIMGVDILICGHYIEKKEDVIINIKMLDIKTESIIQLDPFQGMINRNIFLLLDKISVDVIKEIKKIETNNP